MRCLHDPFDFSESRVIRVLKKVPKGESISSFKKLVDRLRNDVHNLVSLLLMQQTQDEAVPERRESRSGVRQGGTVLANVLFKN